MPKALSQEAAAQDRADDTGAHGKSYRRAMSDHVAYALLVYTGLHIFVTMKAVNAGAGAVLPYLALIVLVAAIIPACRWFEKRWENNGKGAMQDAELETLFRRDTVCIWLGAIGLPLLITGACKLGLMLF